MSLKPTRECPICGSTSGKCREHLNKPGQYLCMTFADIRKGEVISGYKCTGHTKNHFWAMFALDNSQEWSDERRREWEREKAERQAREKEITDHIRSKSLSEEERDRQYRALLSELKLDDVDCADLKSRGFSDEEILLCGYKSVSKYQQLQKRYSDLLPGLSTSGKSLINFNSGYLLPVRNSKGLIVACQVRLRECGSGRYRWLTSKTKSNPKGQSPHIHNKGFSELPLAVFCPENPKGIALVEGVGQKPFLVNRRLHLAVIGAAGGQWTSSPNIFKTELTKLAEKVGTREITIFPDAGDVANKAVLNRWREVHQLLKEWGYNVKFAWWDQLTKLDYDIDELPSSQYQEIEYLHPEPFFEIGKRKNGFDWTHDWAWQKWVNNRKFTPDIIVNQDEFEFPELLDKGVIIAVKSGLGTGKTKALINLIKLYEYVRAMLIGYRNNLLFQTASRALLEALKLYHLREDDGISMLADAYTHLLFCLDSIGCVDGYFDGVDIYLDEVVSVLLHATSGGTLGDEQGKAIAILTRALQVCNRVIILDGNLADIHVNFIAKISGKKVIKIENTAKIKPHTFKFVVGVDEECEIKKRDKSPLIKAMLADDVIPWIASDSKTLTNIIGEIFRSVGKRGYVLNNDTAGETWAKEFLVNPDEFIANHKPDYFIISPTAESGVSVTIKNHFTDKFTFFTGVQGTNSQHQMLFRLRDDSITHYVFCPEFSQVRDRNNPGNYSVKAYIEAQNSRIMQSAMLAAGGNTNQIMKVIGDAIARSNDDWWALSAELGSIDNYEMNNLRNCLIYALSDVGHSVEVVEWEIDKGFKDKEKSAKEVVQYRHALELFKAIKFENVELANAAAKSNPNKETQRRIEKTRLLDRLPDIENSSVWSPEFILACYIKDREFISKQQRFYMLNHFDISKKRSEVNWYYLATNQHFFLGQAKGDSHLKVWALQELNIMQFLSGEYHKESPEVLELMNKIRIDKEIARALNIKIPKETITKQENITFVAQLLDSIGVKFAKPTQVLINGVKTRLYTVDQEKLNLPSRLEVLKAIARKFDGYLTSDTVAKVKWEEHIKTSQPQPEPQPQKQPEIQSELQPEITASQAEPIDHWLEEDNIIYIAECLELCESPSELNELRLITPAAALKLAARRLPEAKREIIKQWVIAA